MRYFVELVYNGTRFNGWQIQPNAPSVQQTIEEAFSLLLRTPISITGCGRTDTGVHASQYFMHFDFEGEFPKAFLKRINKYIGNDIVFKSLGKVPDDLHARFNATKRSYTYFIILEKNPFKTETAFHFPFGDSLDFKKTQEAAQLLLQYDDFFPFCKTHSDAKTMQCDLMRSEWVQDKNNLTFHISANRFLRGMVRLIVGACLNVGLGKITLEDLKYAMDNQVTLKKSYSVPPQGLFLSGVEYGSYSSEGLGFLEE